MKKTMLFLSMTFILSYATNAQGWLNKVGAAAKDAAKRTMEKRVEEKAEQVTDKVLDKAEDAVTKSTKSNKKQTDKTSGDIDEQIIDKQEHPKQKLTSITQYDFVPGDKILFFEDFSQDAIGDFPALWTTNGSGEVRTLKNYSGNWLYMNSRDNVYCLMKDLELPTNFILEFDVIPTPIEENGNRSSFYMTLFQGDGEYLNEGLYPGEGGMHVSCEEDSWGVNGYKQEANGIDGNTEIAPIDVNKLNHVIIWVQKRRLRIYHKGQKALDLPTVLYENVKYNRLRFSLWGHEGFPYISNIRITSAAPDTRSKLLTEGKVVSYGIYFNVNSDQLQPESRGAIADIAKVLTENPDVKVKIVGHTDSDGADAANLDLSKRRAAAVKNEMVKTFAIGADRLITDGAGESQPVSSNSTAAGKAQNRRVEFIKL